VTRVATIVRKTLRANMVAFTWRCVLLMALASLANAGIGVFIAGESSKVQGAENTLLFEFLRSEVTAANTTIVISGLTKTQTPTTADLPVYKGSDGSEVPSGDVEGGKGAWDQALGKLTLTLSNEVTAGKLVRFRIKLKNSAIKNPGVKPTLEILADDKVSDGENILTANEAGQAAVTTTKPATTTTSKPTTTTKMPPTTTTTMAPVSFKDLLVSESVKTSGKDNTISVQLKCEPSGLALKPGDTVTIENMTMTQTPDNPQMALQQPGSDILFKDKAAWFKTPGSLVLTVKDTFPCPDPPCPNYCKEKLFNFKFVLKNGQPRKSGVQPYFKVNQQGLRQPSLNLPILAYEAVGTTTTTAKPTTTTTKKAAAATTPGPTSTTTKKTAAATTPGPTTTTTTKKPVATTAAGTTPAPTTPKATTPKPATPKPATPKPEVTQNDCTLDITKNYFCDMGNSEDDPKKCVANCETDCNAPFNVNGYAGSSQVDKKCVQPSAESCKASPTGERFFCSNSDGTCGPDCDACTGATKRDVFTYVCTKADGGDGGGGDTGDGDSNGDSSPSAGSCPLLTNCEVCIGADCKWTPPFAGLFFLTGTCEAIGTSDVVENVCEDNSQVQFLFFVVLAGVLFFCRKMCKGKATSPLTDGTGNFSPVPRSDSSGENAKSTLVDNDAEAIDDMEEGWGWDDDDDDDDVDDFGDFEMTKPASPAKKGRKTAKKEKKKAVKKEKNSGGGKDGGSGAKRSLSRGGAAPKSLDSKGGGNAPVRKEKVRLKLNVNSSGKRKDSKPRRNSKGRKSLDRKSIKIVTEDAEPNKDLFSSLGMAASPQFAEGSRKKKAGKKPSSAPLDGMGMLQPTKSYDDDDTIEPEVISLDISNSAPDQLQNPFDDGPGDDAPQAVSNPFDDEGDGWDDEESDEIEFGDMAYDGQ
jgi:hypothetical protein